MLGRCLFCDIAFCSVVLYNNSKKIGYKQFVLRPKVVGVYIYGSC